MNKRILGVLSVVLTVLVSISAFTLLYDNGVQTNSQKTTTENVSPFSIPTRLTDTFPKTDWTRADKRLERAVSGGPAKDGIPALLDPLFVPMTTFEHSSSVRAVVLKGKEGVKVYPYNILTWHEIINDTVDGVPVAITFCPLCGSAIVYERALGGKETTFGVSGFLLESNMIMYDRATESLWQQSTGKALAGAYSGNTLTHYPFQLLTIGEIRTRYPDAQIVSEETGYVRDYVRNPYAGYEDTNTTFFEISTLDGRYHPKELFVVHMVGEKVFGAPWDTMRLWQEESRELDGHTFVYTVRDGEVFIRDTMGKEVPFYFEMWFSLIAQHGSHFTELPL